MRRLSLRWFILPIALAWTAGPGAQMHSRAQGERDSAQPAEGNADLSSFAPGYAGVVFTQIPVSRVTDVRPLAGGMLRTPYGDGGRLALLSKDGSTRVLTPDFESAADAAVSFDGKRILFAGKRAATDGWNVFEMNADGSGVRQITRGLGNCRSPMYQSAVFYLNDPKPSYQITFVSDAAGELNEYGPIASTNLYSVRFDGSGARRLTYAVSSSYDPFQMQDGRILFSNWQRSQLENGVQGRIDLFGLHLDGTDYAAFSGTQGRRIKHMACTTTKRMAVFVESDKLPWDGAGNLAALSLRRNLHSYKAITTAADGLFHSPSPLPDGSILVSRRPPDGAGTHSICRLDLDTGRRTLVFRDPGYHNLQAVAVFARAEPDGHSSVVEDDQNWSKLYCLTVYENDLRRDWMPPGTPKRVRVLEGLPRTPAGLGDYLDSMSAGGYVVPGATNDSLSGMIQKRLLGEVALDEDGSFHLQVPPNTPVQLQLLDGNGMALRTSSWIWAKNKENRGCIGCHEDNERTPENLFAKALGHPAAQLTLPPERRRTVGFRRDVMPVLAAKCSSNACHGGAAQPRFDTGAALVSHNYGKASFPAAYEQLLAKPNQAPRRADRGQYVDPGRARTSRLVWAIFGRNTARPGDAVEPLPSIKRMPPAGSPPLTEEERQSIIEWIDFGAQFNPAPSNGAAGAARSSGGQR
jgi:hypothetical protein